MQKLWNKVAKEAKVGWNTAIKATGIKKDVEDPDFIQRRAKFGILQEGATHLLRLCSTYTKDMMILSETTEELDSYVKDQEQPGTVRGICARFNQELDVKCMRPLREFLTRVSETERIQKKRWRNRELVQTSKGLELDKRTEKYTKYHRAFVTAVDQLDVIFAQLVPQVFAGLQWTLQEYYRALSLNAPPKYQGSTTTTGGFGPSQIDDLLQATPLDP